MFIIKVDIFTVPADLLGDLALFLPESSCLFDVAFRFGSVKLSGNFRPQFQKQKRIAKAEVSLIAAPKSPIASLFATSACWEFIVSARKKVFNLMAVLTGVICFPLSPSPPSQVSPNCMPYTTPMRSSICLSLDEFQIFSYRCFVLMLISVVRQYFIVSSTFLMNNKFALIDFNSR